MNLWSVRDVYVTRLLRFALLLNFWQFYEHVAQHICFHIYCCANRYCFGLFENRSLTTLQPLDVEKKKEKKTVPRSKTRGRALNQTLPVHKASSTLNLLIPLHARFQEELGWQVCVSS